MLTDGQGLVESVITTPANCADTVVLPELIEKAELTQGVSVLADKGYCSKKNSACLLERGLIDEYLGGYGIQSEAYAWASCAPERQIARKSPLSGG